MLVTLARHRNRCPALEPHFAVCFEGRLAAELTRAAVPLYHLGEVRIRRPWTVWQARRNLRNLLRRLPFDVVVNHSAWPQAIFGPVVRDAGRLLVFWLHNVTDGKHWLERWAGQTRPDLAVANSRFTASLMPRLFPRVPVEAVHCPVEAAATSCSNPQAVRSELATRPEAVVIIQVSRMEALKGHFLHLHALGMLRDVPGWVFWLVGGAQRPHEARYVNELLQAAQRLGLSERIRFLGQRSDVAALLAAADIFCQPNTAPEGFGISLIEALVAGLPVVTTELGAASEIVDGACGVLVPPANAPALAAVLRRLIQEPAWRNSLAVSRTKERAAEWDAGVSGEYRPDGTRGDRLVFSC
jgi:glycosyltransferase involved in cell wall biosynthesis